MDNGKDKTVIDQDMPELQVQIEQADTDQTVDASNKRLAAYNNAFGCQKDK